jgi:hypothetical protein
MCFGLILNVCLILVGVRLSRLEAERDDLALDEYYFVINDSSARLKRNEVNSLRPQLLQIQILGRLAAGRLKPDERKALKRSMEIIREQIRRGENQLLGMATVQAGNDPPNTASLERLADTLSEDEVLQRTAILENEAFRRMGTQKPRLAALNGQIPIWQLAQNIGLIITGLIFALGTTFAELGSRND